MLDAVNAVVLIFDPKSYRILDANKRAVQAYGYSKRQLLGKELTELTHEVPNYSDFTRSAGSIERTDFNKNGEPLQFLVGLSLIDYWGRKAVLSMQRDIGDRKAIEAAIAASEKKVKSLLEGISEILLLIDAKGEVKFISPQVERVLGYTVQEVEGRNVFDYIHPDDLERTSAEYAKTVSEPGEAVPSVLRIRNQEGQWIPFEIIANNQLNDPDIAAVIFTGRDLRYRREAEQAVRQANADFEKRVEERTTEMAKANAALRIENQQRRHTEAQLKQSLSLLFSTLESTADGILVISNEGFISSCNQRYLDMWGIPKMALVGLKDENVLAIATPQVQDPAAFQRRVQELYAQPEAVSFDSIKLKDGRIFERCSQPQRVEGQIVGRVWSFRDVTQSHLLQEELHQAQKMEAVGRLAGGVAHDFNNLLMLISGYAGQMLEDPKFPEKHREAGQQLMQAAQRAASLTRQLLAFSRKHPVVPQVVDLNSVVRDMEKMLQRLLSDRIRLVLQLHKEPLPVFADPSQVELVIMNLAINARDAMPDGGVLSIKTVAEVLPGVRGEQGEAVSSGYAVLEVTDTGYGMAPEIKEHIFEPFFTTKTVGKGTGLGLSTVYGIVEQAGGHISVESEPNRGSTFHIYLPKSSAMVSEIAAVQEPPPATGRETLLLVEDEAGIRSMTRVYLESLGYKVLEAGDAREALQLSRQHQGTIEMLLTDVVMPGARGDALVRALVKERPGLKALFMSGYADLHRLEVDAPVIEKPFAFPELGRRVRAVLDDIEIETEAKAEVEGHDKVEKEAQDKALRREKPSAKKPA
jgi:PAS domain S-box-containing protein